MNWLSMTTKILCWLDGFSPHFAIVNAISRKTDYDLYGLINVNEERKFCEKQKFLRVTTHSDYFTDNLISRKSSGHNGWR